VKVEGKEEEEKRYREGMDVATEAVNFVYFCWIFFVTGRTEEGGGRR
jgi:hypothetical protein